MQSLNFTNEMQEIADQQKLVEIKLDDATNFICAYLIKVTDKFIMFAEISSSVNINGIFLTSLDRVESISHDTLYLKEFSKRLPAKNLFSAVQQNVKDINKFTPGGLLQHLVGSKTLVELTDNNGDSVAGRIIGISERFILIDEYYAEYSERFSRKYINAEYIVRIGLDVPWIKTIELALAERGL